MSITLMEATQFNAFEEPVMIKSLQRAAAD